MLLLYCGKYLADILNSNCQLDHTPRQGSFHQQ